MSIKLLLANVIVAFFLPGLILVPSWADQIEQKIVVYNRLNYIPEGVLEDFTKETGINVEYSTYSNDELLFTKTRLLKGRGYDVLISSTDLVDRMRREGLIQPIDHHKLPSYKQLDPSLLNKPYDPQNEFSIPYLWGSTGITIDTSMVDVNKITSWQDLWHRQWRDKLLLINDMREVFHIALKVNGYSINTTDPEEIKRAYEKLRALLPNIKVGSLEARKNFLSDTVDLGVTKNDEAVKTQADNLSVQYVYPREGANFWIDSFVVPSRSTNVENAHKFIDYILRPEIAARCVEELGYASSNLAARGLLSETLRNNPAIFPPQEVLSKVEFQKDIGAAIELYQLYWGKLIAGN